jgi:hypothetical protein
MFRWTLQESASLVIHELRRESAQVARDQGFSEGERVKLC